jgi:hypothetical protein
MRPRRIDREQRRIEWMTRTMHSEDEIRRHCIVPQWPAPKWVRAYATTRTGGVSQGPFASLNLGDHVGDDPHAVMINRRRLRWALELPAEPVWLRQVHGNTVVAAHEAAAQHAEADAAFSDRGGVVCAVLTADCLPVLLCDTERPRVAAVHAGWRGLAAGVIERALQCFDSANVIAWLGPAIGPQAFEVGDDVVTQLAQGPDGRTAMRAAAAGHWLVDIYELTRRRLQAAGVGAVYGGGFCTVNEHQRFFSYRREHTTGRMAALIWVVHAQ